jgi:hypothetical protein
MRRFVRLASRLIPDSNTHDPPPAIHHPTTQETIKDSLNAGLPVPRHFIVPAQRFNRQLGAAMGINVAEFE